MNGAELRTHPLVLALGAAVPLEIDRMRAVDDELRAQQIATVLPASSYPDGLTGPHGDDLLYGGKRCVDAFAEVARALACLAWAMGGINFAGLHFCAQHEECLEADKAATS
jgi:hypothetical protein